MGGSSSKLSLKKRKSFKDIQTVHILRRKSSRRFSQFLSSFSGSNVFRSLSLASSSRQSSLSGISKEKFNNEMFSDYEIELIRSSWAPIDVETFGMKVYIRVFDCEPSLKIFFSWQDLSTDDLMKNEKFRQQSNSIINVISNCVKSLENIKSTTDFLHQLGKYHTKLRGYGFRPEHWVIFKLSILLSLAFSIQGDQNKHACLEAWNTLITFIIDEMKFGFNSTLKLYYGQHTTYTT